MDGIIRLVELAVWSTALAGERNSVSLLLVAKPESGKSDVLERFRNTQNVISVRDLTAWGLTSEILPRIYKANQLQTILVPDFINVLSRNTATVANFMQTIKSMMEEGIDAIHTYSMNFRYPRPLTAGLLTSITPSEFQTHRKAWTKSGILSRFIVLSYEHSNSTQERVHTFLEDQVTVARENTIQLPLPAKSTHIEADGPLLRPMRKIVYQYREKLGLLEDGYGYRTQLHFQRLVAAHALSSGRTIVEQIDVDSVTTLLSLFANLDYQKV